MKKKAVFIMTVLAVGFISTAYAQENKVVSAKMHLDEYTKDNDTSALSDAKDAIDLAVANEKTKDEPKMWLYRGMVYRAVFEHTLNNCVSKLMIKEGKPTTREGLLKLTGEAYASLDTTALSIAAFSFARVIALVPKDYYADEARGMLPVCSAHIENKATSDYSRQQYPTALAMFEKAIWLGHVEGAKDTSDFISQNIQNASITADKLKNYPKALMYYQEMIDLKIGGSQPYLAAIAIYNNNKDSAKSLDLLKKARAAFPGDVNLLISETNYYLQSHNNDKAIDNLQKAISKLEGDNKPDNKSLLSNLYFVLGNTYDRLANPKNDSGRSLPKPANYEDLFTKAETNYTKAINLTPENFDEIFDLGALYNNRATAINRQANELPVEQTDKFNKLQAEAADYFKKSQPWLEKAHGINKTDQGCINALLQIYASTGQTDKIKDLKSGK
jgi:tetratricopeptide (TPR) repeat protein